MLSHVAVMKSCFQIQPEEILCRVCIFWIVQVASYLPGKSNILYELNLRSRGRVSERRGLQSNNSFIAVIGTGDLFVPCY